MGIQILGDTPEITATVQSMHDASALIDRIHHLSRRVDEVVANMGLCAVRRADTPRRHVRARWRLLRALDIHAEHVLLLERERAELGRQLALTSVSA